ncbi:MAG TPA: cbb3-type cytochrome c oxidase subunit I [candidate division Zixibacteria bacterium]|nr:cbb3-type cytochrome c oxidase subunit I [candidate division Zixibacteria bacterium]MDD4917673.1 cbb3-type cytochrome c oxidase subunit I [candidate division Zixibacteria bacterium]MDM7974077.1 cbb3-type cytochrome c oxidase subunit I [candidate division Zixibacteria bacterium]HOD65564.1 cbb3-type cytochrome c oxidase subunit I [candidate division Zixibacteria bacterium]HOZ06674.1 cbb3-type cytochrome c oxidase subunit I [candidate division Zixibacteria bacterium]
MREVFRGRIDRLRPRRVYAAARAAGIARLYAAGIGIAFAIGLAAAAALLAELATPRPDLLDNTRFGAVLTLHGTVMVFLVLIPMLPAVIGNLLVPQAVGAAQTALPRLTLAGWGAYVLGAAGVIAGAELSGYQGGWRMILPPEVGTERAYGVLAAGLAAAAIATTLVNVALAWTILSRRHRTVPMAEMPLLAWFFLLGSLVQTAVVPIRLFFLLLQSSAGLAESAAAWFGAADPVSFQQTLFWMYANPAILAVVLPAAGIALDLLGGAGRPVRLPRRTLITAGMAVALLSLVSWGQHLLTAAEGSRMAAAGSLYGLLAIVPATVIFGLLLRAWLRARLAEPALNAALFGQAAAFAALAASGSALAAPGLGVHLQDTYATVGHLHFGALGIGVMAFVAGTIHARSRSGDPRCAGRAAARWIYGMTAGLLLTFLPLAVVGAQGAPRAFHEYARGTQPAHLIAAAGGAVLIVSLAGLAIHLRRGARPRETAETPAALGRADGSRAAH